MKREIPQKNYVILFFIFLATILLCTYISSWYKMSEEAKMPKGIMTEFLPEVKIEELDTYLQENSNIILYISSSADENTKRFEKKLYDYISSKGNVKSFTYLDVNDTAIRSVKEVLEARSTIKNGNFTIVPNLYVIKDGKVADALYYTKKPLNSKEAIQFIEKQDAIE